MLTRTNKNNSLFLSPFRIAVLLVFLFLLVTSVNAQKTDNKNLPVWQSYKGVSIGMTDAQVREKLGAPKSEDDGGFFYTPSETETVQVLLDAAKKVRTVSVIFSAEHTGAPTFAEVFGKTAEAQPKPDGSVYKLVRFEDAGYWVSYSRMAGDKAMVIVMIQKL